MDTERETDKAAHYEVAVVVILRCAVIVMVAIALLAAVEYRVSGSCSGSRSVGAAIPISRECSILRTGTSSACARCHGRHESWRW